MMTLSMIMTGVVQGLVLSLITYGVMIPFRLLNLPDVSAEGLYTLVGATTAVLVSGYGWHPVSAIILGGLVGVVMSGGLVSMVITKLHINSLLAGIIISTMAYSMTLRIMGRPNLALLSTNSFFSNSMIMNSLILFAIVLSMASSLYFLLHTEIGLRLRALGHNPAFAKRNGISIARYTMLGLAFAGLFTGIAGCCMVQLQHYMDINMGIGICIHALAALMIGEAVVGTRTLLQQIAAPLIGALVYQQIQGVAFSYGLAPSDLKFFTGLLVLIVIAVGSRRRANVAA